MARDFNTYWYQEDEQFRRAFLYHLRDRDVQVGGRIPRGAVIRGALGFFVAESDVEGYSAEAVPFCATRRCQWQGLEIPCMVHPSAPAAGGSKPELRRYNCIIGDVTPPDARALAESLKLPVIKSDGRFLVNLEISTFQAQGKGSPRRAKLI